MASRSTSIMINEARRAELFPDKGENAGSAAIARTYAGLTDFIRLLRRRRRLIILTIGTIMVVTCVMLARTTPIYKATTTVLVKPTEDQTNLLPQGDTPIVAPPNEAARIATKVRLLGSRSLAATVVQSAGLQKVDEFAASKEESTGIMGRVLKWLSPSVPEDEWNSELSRADVAKDEQQRKLKMVTDNFLRHLTVNRVADSNLIDITVTSKHPKLSALLSNRVAQTYIKGLTEAQDDADQATNKWLDQRITALDQHLNETETAIAEYRQQHGLAVDRAGEMQQAQLTQAGISLSEARAERAAVNNQQSGRSDAIRVSSALLDNLRVQEATLARRISELEPYYGRNYPELIASNSQLAEVRRRIAAETARAQAAANEEAGGLTAAAGAREAQLARETATLRGQSIESRFANVGLQRLEREAETTRALYLSLLARAKQQGSQEANEADISIVSRAALPDQPSFPQPSQVLAVALVSAVTFALVLALAAEAVDDRLRNADQVRRLLDLPTLAMVPQLPKSWGDLPATEMITRRPSSLFSESMRNLVIELETRRTHPGAQVIVVTSPVPDDGKSTISACLAAAAASLGRRGIVVDLDMRRSDKEGGNEDDGRADLVAFLADQANLDELLVDGEQTFATISIKQKVIDPGGLLESPRLRALLDELRNRFDLIALNAPPIIPVRDAKTLSRIADGALLVIRWGVTDPSAAATAVDIFGDGLIGVVMNGVDYREHARRAYGDAIDHAARYGGEYLQQDRTPKRWPVLGWLRS